MRCMRCGKDTENNQVFCPECLAVMEQYPVSANVTVRLPRRPDPQIGRKPQRRKQPSEEEQLRTLKRRMRIMTWILAAAVTVIIAVSIPAIMHFVDDHVDLLPGQNYSVASDAS